MLQQKKNYILQADTECEEDEWICSIQNAISDSISNFQEKNIQNNNKKEKNSDNNIKGLEIEKKNNLDNKIINDIINNNICSDCGAKKPTWLSTNWLTIICIDCSSIHRSLGANISKVKAFQLDNLGNDLIELLMLIKQEEINKFLENNLINDEKPKEESIYNDKEKFIINKYKNKKYMEKNNLNISKEDSINLLIKAIDDNNLLDAYKLIKENTIDINCIYDIKGEEYCFLHYCAGKGKIQMAKLLFILGADINKEDTKGLKPIIYAKLNKNIEIVNYLNEKEKT